jgi:Superfamily II DNA and RNA helicases
VLVFVASQRSSENLAQKLAKAGFQAEALHGDLGQGRRARVLQGFAEGRVKWLVATDVAARGIDIAGLPLVINYDLPRSTDDYLHRIGRSGRAGTQGMAISLLTEANQAHLRLIEKRHRLQLPREVVAGFEPQAAAPGATGTPVTGADNGGIKGKRPSKKDRLRAAQAAGQ